MPSLDPVVLAAINPRIRKSPFFDDTVEAGLESVSSYNHMWLPTGYGDPEAEYDRLTRGVSMWDVSAQRHVEVRGAAADELVQWVTTVDTTEVPVGSGIYAPIVDFRGTLLNDPVLLHMGDGTWRFSISDSDVRLWIDAVANCHELDATVRELDTATLAVQGPVANDVFESLGCGFVEDLEHFQRHGATVDGLDVTVSRSGWSTQGGYEIFLHDPEHASQLWSAVLTAGSAFGIGPGYPNQSERIENVLLSYGTDTGFEADPLELGLGDHIDLEGPAFIGQEALRTIRDQGAQRHLVGAFIGGPPIDRFGHPTSVTVDGRPVGQLRAAAWSPRFSANLGLALVGSDVAAGSGGRTETPSGTRKLRLVELPFEEYS